MVEESILNMLVVLQLCMVCSDGDGRVGMELGLVDDNRTAGCIGSYPSDVGTLARARYMEADPDAFLCSFFALSRWSHGSSRHVGNDTLNGGGV